MEDNRVPLEHYGRNGRFEGVRGFRMIVRRLDSRKGLLIRHKKGMTPDSCEEKVNEAEGAS